MAPGSKSVFVGNIPFSLSEEEIVQILSTAGTVVKFRLMTDSATGKPKGFGFTDYADADAAASAVRNLNDYEIQGRKLRVDWPHNNEKDSVPQGYDQNSAAEGANPQGYGASSLPPLPVGTELPPNLKCTDAISQTLSALPPQQLLDVLTQMKALAISDPGRAIELLNAAPQLSYAVFQALILMNLVDSKVLAQVVEQSSRPPQMANIPPQQPPQQYPGFAPPIPQQHMMPPRPQQPQYGAPPPMPQQPPQGQTFARRVDQAGTCHGSKNNRFPTSDGENANHAAETTDGSEVTDRLFQRLTEHDYFRLCIAWRLGDTVPCLR